VQKSRTSARAIVFASLKRLIYFVGDSYFGGMTKTRTSSKINYKQQTINLKLDSKHLRTNSPFEGGWGDVNSV